LETELHQTKCIATTNGAFAQPESVRLRPEEVLQQPIRDWLEAHDRAERAGAWCHLSIEQRERRARAARLGVRAAQWPEWLLSITTSKSINSVKAVLELIQCAWPFLTAWVKAEIAGTSFLLTQTGTLVAPKDNLYLPGPVPPSNKTIQFVHESIAKDRR